MTDLDPDIISAIDNRVGASIELKIFLKKLLIFHRDRDDRKGFTYFKHIDDLLEEAIRPKKRP